MTRGFASVSVAAALTVLAALPAYRRPVGSRCLPETADSATGARRSTGRHGQRTPRYLRSRRDSRYQRWHPRPDLQTPAHPDPLARSKARSPDRGTAQPQGRSAIPHIISPRNTMLNRIRNIQVPSPLNLSFADSLLRFGLAVRQLMMARFDV